ncbi:MAG: hypothetical protein JRF43_00465 [Deltaproteobacteria bacterium]|nr:hypothetical protein [Deltaproteobacteria bacterium]
MKRLFGFALVLVFMLSGIANVFAYEEISPEEANATLSSNPNAYILDIRTPEEWYYVGHPGKDKCGNGAFLEEPIRKVINIPWELWEYVPQDKKYDRHIPNRFFDEEVVRQFDPDDTIIVMCRSGKRSEKATGELASPSGPACKRLEELGFYNILDMSEGFEGGRDSCRHRTLNQGWKNKGLPYIDNNNGIWTPQQKGRSLNP